MTIDFEQIGLVLPDAKIVEGIVTTTNADGSTNIAPMGPLVDESFSKLRLRPFKSSTTYENLDRSGEGIFHVTDDVELLARSAVNRLDTLPPMRAAECFKCQVLTNACRWYAFRVEQLDDTNARTEILAGVADRGRIRDFLGFNRAQHAVLEAAILATRLHLLPRDQVRSDVLRLAELVDKTGGNAERRAFTFISQYIESRV